MRPDTTADLPAERTIRSSRLFGATRKNVWSFFENPVHLGAWWGPEGFTNTFEAFEFREGGTWRFVMHGPDGSAYPMSKTFVTIHEYAGIVLDHDDPIHGHRLFMLFKDVGDGTLLEWLMVFDHAEEAAKVRPFVEPANEQNLDRLQAFLTRSSQGAPP